jgi:hypothetical protein
MGSAMISLIVFDDDYLYKQLFECAVVNVELLLNQEVYKEHDKWLSSNFGPELTPKIPRWRIINSFVYFKNKEDATLYVLRWST